MSGYLDDNTEEEAMMQAELEDDSVFEGLLSQQAARADVLKSRMQQKYTAKAALAPMNQESIVGAKEALARSGIAPQNVGPGFVEGYLKAQDNRRADAVSRRADKGAELAQGEFGIKNEQMNWAREAHAKEDIIQVGMAEAGKEGGYEAVIDYLKGADPARAMEFQTAKNGLDASMMKNQVMKATVPSETAKAMAEGYGALGQMGAAVLRANPEERQGMYEAMQPMIRTINPDAPANVTDALPMFQLAMAQSIPANLLYGAKKELSGTLSAQEKVARNIEARAAAGETVENSPAMAALVAQQNIVKERLLQTQIKVANAKVDTINKQQDNMSQQMAATETISKNLQTSSKDFTTFMDTFTGVEGALNTLQKDPTNSQAMHALSRSFVKSYNKGQTSETDALIGMSAVGMPALKKKLEGFKTGQEVVLNEAEIKNLANSYQQLQAEKLAYQKSVESQYEKSTVSYGNLVNWKDIRKPSEAYMEYARGKIDEQKTGIPADLQAMADNALKQNKDPALVKQMLDKLVAERKANAQQ